MDHGRKGAMTLLPSRGGKGSMLKTAKITFSSTDRTRRLSRKSTVAPPADNTMRKRITEMTARRRFIAGPAMATQIMLQRGFLNALKLTGTGLAQPKTKPAWEMISSKGRRIVPKG